MIDSEWFQRLREAMSSDARIEAGWVFGSRVSGRPFPWSDTDVAVLLRGSVPRDAYLRVQLDLMASLPPPTDGSAIDLVILNEVPPELSVSILWKGALVVAKDPDCVRDTKEAALRDFFDLAPFRAMMGEAQDRRIREGRFGDL